LLLDLMNADVPETAKLFSPGPLFSKAGDFGVLVHSFFIVNVKALSCWARV
jgi:hypothetical protein